ncbi:MAG TPA: cytochrome ubiquinol oxidase subunit I, partial [Ktedonobacteraceae bacterium]|nr:cytochrome ubiquinol oxidase subunit I [Ktedonobacteraceae bacterium]
GPAAFLALELGWIVTEEGRQPWIIYGYLRVQDAVNPAQWIDVSFLIFVFIYLVLGTTLTVLLLKLARQPKKILPWSEYIKVEGQDDEEEQGEQEEKQPEKVGAK